MGRTLGGRDGVGWLPEGLFEGNRLEEERGGDDGWLGAPVRE